MHAGRIQGATLILGAPKEWDRDRDGFCGGLAVRQETTTAGATMVSAWLPTPDEIERIREGAPIYVYVVDTVHPPITVGVGPRPGFNG